MLRNRGVSLKMKKTIKYISFLFLVAGLIMPANAQWKSESFTLERGWNAIYTHVDASHTTIENLTQDSGVIEEVWKWNPKLSTLQYVQSPDQPLNNSSRWLSWTSADKSGSPLQKLVGNAAYLVKASQPLNWNIKGKPLPPRYQWTSSGLNFIGFSTSSSSPPIFSNFLNPVNGFGTGSQIFSYNGAVTDPTPSELFTLNTSTVKRGQAYWIRAKGYNRYYGPFELSLQDYSGVHFGDSLSSYKITLKNTTSDNLVVNMQFVDSEAAPIKQGIPSVKARPPVIMRGDLRSDTLTFDYTSIGTSVNSWTLKPMGEAGSTVEIILGVNWAQLAGSSGDFFAGLLYFFDNSNHLQTILPVSAYKPDTTGLWVGNAKINQVRHGMKSFKESFVEGDVKADINATDNSPLSVSWIKNEAVSINSNEYVNGADYFESELGFHRIVKKDYVNVSQGDRLWFPTADENGNFLTNPSSYWMARPIHDAYLKGWYWNKGVIVATGDKESIEMTFVNRTTPVSPAGYSLFEDKSEGANAASWWYLEKAESYTGVEVGDSIDPPNVDENGSVLAEAASYWQPTGTNVEFADGVFTSKVAGDFTVKWRKKSAEPRGEKKIIKSVYRGQKLIASDIYTEDMPASVWYINNPPLKPNFVWEGSLAKTSSGGYQVEKNVSSWGKVAKPMKLRMIVHNDKKSPSVANLLQRVYFGIDNENSSLLIATKPNLLPEDTPEVRRVSSVHLPWSEVNQPWKLNGSFGKGSTLSVSVVVEHNDLTSNPFIHNYHPDHDNLDARFEKKLQQGNESFQIKRDITIKLNGSQPGFNGLALGGKVLSGEYEEIVTLGGKAKLSGGGYENRQYGMRGVINFNRVTTASTLKTD